LVNVLGIPAGTARIITKAQGWTIYFLLIAVPAAIFLSVTIAAIGGGTLNLVISYLLLVVMLVLATWPEVLMAVIGLGAASNPNDPLAGIRTELNRWMNNFVLTVMLVVAAYFYLLGTLPIGRNYTNIISVVMGAIVLALLSVKAVIARKLIFAYAVCVITLGIGGMIAPELFYKTFGFDPVPFLSFNAADYRYARIKGMQHEAEVAENNRRLAEIEAKYEQGIPLSFQDEQFLRQYAEKNSMAGKVRKLMSENKSHYDPLRELVPTQQHDVGRYPVKLKAGQWTPYWIKISSSMKLRYDTENTDGRYIRLYSDGQKIYGKNEAPYMPEVKFRIYAITDQDMTLVINPES